MYEACTVCVFWGVQGGSLRDRGSGIGGGVWGVGCGVWGLVRADEPLLRCNYSASFDQRVLLATAPELLEAQ